MFRNSNSAFIRFSICKKWFPLSLSLLLFLDELYSMNSGYVSIELDHAECSQSVRKKESHIRRARETQKREKKNWDNSARDIHSFPIDVKLTTEKRGKNTKYYCCLVIARIFCQDVIRYSCTHWTWCSSRKEFQFIRGSHSYI